MKIKKFVVLYFTITLPIIIVGTGIKVNAFNEFVKFNKKMSNIQTKLVTSKKASDKAKEYLNSYIAEIKQKEERERQEKERQERAKKRTYASGSLSEQEAKEQIARHESDGDYNAVSPSGKYIGRYQLDRRYLNGDYSPENQERVANEYVQSRYGSWANARAHQQQCGWY